MGQTVRIFQVDAFTSTRFAGNPAGVVLDADALSDVQMQAIARELNNGDTAFVLPPDADDHDLRVRFFTPRKEAGFVGHATLAVHAVLSHLGEQARPRQKQRSGIVVVDTVPGSRPERIAIHQPPPPLLGEPETRQLAAVLEALALDPTQLDQRCPPRIAGSGSTRLLLGVERGAVLAQVRPDPVRLAALSEQIGAAGYFLYTLRPEVPDVYTEARMFCPALGIPEDPVSGNAHALLGHHLLRLGLLDPGTGITQFTGAQGHHCARPGRVTVALSSGPGGLESVSIMGEAVVVFGASMQI